MKTILKPCKDIERMTGKTLAVKMNIPVKSASALLTEIKKELEIKRVCMYHVREYLQVPHAQNM